MLKPDNKIVEGVAVVEKVETSTEYKRAAHKSSSFTVVDSLMRYAEKLGYGNVHVKVDQKTGLKAIIAVHNLTRGPAIGGCRFVPYATADKAMEDAIRLGYMMSYK